MVRKYGPKFARKDRLLLFLEWKYGGFANVFRVSDALMPFLEEKYISFEDGVIFQQDYAAAHTAKVTQDFFTSEVLDILAWLAKFAALSIIDKYWCGLCDDCITNLGSSKL